MLYCDLKIDDVLCWSGVPCLVWTNLQPEDYLGFSGIMFFNDSQGSAHPTYLDLGGRFTLNYLPASAALPMVIPLQAIPSQEFSIVLDGQNCIMTFYEKYLPEDAKDALDDYPVVAPGRGPIISWDAGDVYGTGAALSLDVVLTSNTVLTGTVWTIQVPPQHVLDRTLHIAFDDFFGDANITAGGKLIGLYPGDNGYDVLIDIAGSTGGYDFYFYLYCDATSATGTTRLSKRIQVASIATPISWDAPSGYLPYVAGELTVTVTGGSLYHWSVTNLHSFNPAQPGFEGTVVRLWNDNAQSNTAHYNQYDSYGYEFDLNCLVDGVETLTTHLIAPAGS